MLTKLFLEIKKKKNWFVDNGRENEDRIERILRKTSALTKYTKESLGEKDLKILKKYFLKQKKDNLGNFNLSELVKDGFSKSLNNIFIREPFGSQSFPDFLIILNENIVPIEIKNSKGKNKNPMMNNSYFVKDGIYIFSNESNVTFFKGEDIVSDTQFKKLKEFKDRMDDLNKEYEELFETMPVEENIHGFMPYIRSNFKYKKLKKGTNLNFFDKTLTKDREDNVIEYIDNIY